MTTFDTGRNAETKAAEHLKKLGFKIIDTNWRTRWCEIDIVAQKADTIYFVEVKYRESATYGSGLEYITPKKQQQMAFAAQLWVHEHEWCGDYELSALEVTGKNLQITDFIDSIG